MWMAEKLPGAKKLPKDEMCLCVPHVFSCLEDRNGDVRKKAQEVVMPLMIHTGYDHMFKQAAKLKVVPCV
jgi:cytoskeleton-associated protein 5